jgi:hypothetical protein
MRRLSALLAARISATSLKLGPLSL